MKLDCDVASLFLSFAPGILTIAICVKKIDTQVDAEANNNLLERWDVAFNVGDLDSLMSLYAEDALGQLSLSCKQLRGNYAESW